MISKPRTIAAAILLSCSAEAMADQVRALNTVLFDKAGQPPGILVEGLGDRRIVEDIPLHTVLALEVPLDQVHPGTVRP